MGDIKHIGTNQGGFSHPETTGSLPAFDGIKEKLALCKRAKTELDPKDISAGGRYRKWYKRLISDICSEAGSLAQEFLIFPFRILNGVRTDEFERLVSAEMKGIAASVVACDGDEFERLVRKAYSDNTVWIITHGGMFRIPEPAAVKPHAAAA